DARASAPPARATRARATDRWGRSDRLCHTWRATRFAASGFDDVVVADSLDLNSPESDERLPDAADTPQSFEMIGQLIVRIEAAPILMLSPRALRVNVTIRSTLQRDD